MRRARVVLGVIAGLVIVAGLIAAPFGLKPYGIYILTLWAVTTIAAIGLNLTLGYAGQVSLAQGAFVGIGAYVAALLTTKGWPLGAAYLIAGRVLLRHRLAARLSGAARAAPLSRFRHAGLLDAGLSRAPQRGVDHRRHLRHQQHPAAEPVRLRAAKRRATSTISVSPISRWCRSPPGG